MSAKLKDGHRVRKSDQARIRCQAGNCDKPAVWCEYSRWGTPPNNGIAFYYFCKEHKR